jgi:hypothetical protein
MQGWQRRRRGTARPWRAHAVARKILIITVNKSAHTKSTVLCIGRACNGCDRVLKGMEKDFAPLWPRSRSSCASSVCNSSGSQDKAGAGAVRSTRRYCTVGSRGQWWRVPTGQKAERTGQPCNYTGHVTLLQPVGADLSRANHFVPCLITASGEAASQSRAN